ncbi:hypothetical protein T439DRAFT_358325 [Meredithblackwellia eburnea MCA 4105]
MRQLEGSLVPFKLLAESSETVSTSNVLTTSPINFLGFAVDTESSNQIIPPAPAGVAVELPGTTASTAIASNIIKDHALHHLDLQSLQASRTERLLNFSHINYFNQVRNLHQLVQDTGNDPIHRGVVSLAEAETLFSFWWNHLQPLQGILQRKLNTFHNVRSSSSFLLTAILWTASKFVPGFESSCQRLEFHVEMLVAKILALGLSSLEIVEAFLIILAWMDPGPSSSLDRVSTYLALTDDLFSRLTPPEESSDFPALFARRRYERAYVSLYNYLRGWSMLTGKSGQHVQPLKDFVCPITDWASGSVSDECDWTQAALASLRQDLVHVLAAVIRPEGRRVGSSNQRQPAQSPTTVKAIALDFHSSWMRIWLSKSSQAEYLTIVGSYTLLGIHIHALRDHMGESTEDEMVEITYSAALQTLEAFVNSSIDTTLRFLVNNTFSMVAYAAMFALRLLPQHQLRGLPYDSNLLSLVARTTCLMEECGSNPPHRFGRSLLYGRRLKDMLRTSFVSRRPTRQSTPVQEELHLPPQQRVESDDYLVELLSSLENQPAVDQRLDPLGFNPGQLSKAELDYLLDYNWYPTTTKDIFSFNPIPAQF